MSKQTETHGFPVFKEFDGISVSAEFENQYAKKVDLPRCKCIFSTFHPVIPDHVITINELHFPAANRNVSQLVRDGMLIEFEDQIKDTYMDLATKNKIKRGKKTAEVYNFQKKQELGQEFASSSAEDTSSYLEYYSSYDYEGGNTESLEVDSESDEDEAESSEQEQSNSENIQDSPGQRLGTQNPDRKSSDSQLVDEEPDNNLNSVEEQQVVEHNEDSVDGANVDVPVSALSQAQSQKGRESSMRKRSKSRKTSQKAKKKKSNILKRRAKSCFKFCKPSLQKRHTVQIHLPSKMPHISGLFNQMGEKIRKAKEYNIKDSQEQRVYNKAVEMYLEDKNILFGYRGLEYPLIDEDRKEEIEGPDPDNKDLYINPGDAMRMDDYYFDIDREHQYIPHDYIPLPKYEGFSYVPPPFREKYEI